MGALLGAIAGTAGGVISNIENRLLNEQNNATQRELLDMQQKWSHNEAILADERQRQQYLDLYSPQARVEQLKQAGLSVGMMYGAAGAGGTGSTSGNMAATPAATSRQTIPMNNVLDTAARYLAENELIKSQTRKNNAEAGEKESQIPINEKMISFMDTQMDEMKGKMDLYKAEATQHEASAKNQEAMAKYNETLNNLAQIDLKYKDNKNLAEISKLWQEYDNLVEEGEKLGMTNEKLLEVIQTDIKLKLSEELKNAAQAGLFGQEEGYYEQLKIELERTNEVNKGLDEVIDNIIHVLDEEATKSENYGAMKGITKACIALAKLAAVYVKMLSRKPSK